ncbi:RDD family protein [Kitasatospora sp. NPDC001539]|uniref:RDD family protein n=1 Tax=Kitasatospora sp. NPDC001539 TaxID=3154384 RepID=UPI00332ED591
MAQGHPPPQYPQNGCAQPPQPLSQRYGHGPDPYARGPYAQPYGQQQPPRPYGQPPQPYGQQPYPHPPTVLPPCPKEAGGGRRFLATVLDFVLAVGLGFAAARAVDAAGRPKPVAHAAGHAVRHGSGPVVPYFVTLLVAGLLASFLNQVVLTRLTGFSVGKGILAMRVVRRKGVMRPNTWRLTRRWLLGFVYLAVMFLSEDFEVSEGDVVGMRSVRRKHLREYRRAVAPLG